MSPVAVVTVALMFTGAAPAQGIQKSDAFVKVTPKGDKPDADGNQVVLLSLSINKGWHAYANPVGLDDLADAATKVTATGNTQLVKVEYPVGKLHKDPVVGNYRVYEDDVTIKATIRRPADGGPAQLAIKFQVCNESKCLPPGTAKVSVP